MLFELALIKSPSENDSALFRFLFKKIGFEDAIRPKDIIGGISYDGDNMIVVIRNETIALQAKELKKIEIHFQGYEGEFYSQTGRRRWNISLGDRNKIKLRMQDRNIECYLWLKNKGDKANLKKLIEWCYDHKLQLKEYYRARRTFKWKTVNYKAIQEIKKEYGLEEW